MKVALFGREVDKVKDLVISKGFEIVENDPEFVVTYGGDGTVMRSEGPYPGIPKIVLKNSLICKKCSAIPNDAVLDAVIAGNYSVENVIKLQAEAKGKIIVGMNEVYVHNADPRTGIRYSLCVNGKDIGRTIIGDGILVATPYGSTGYYRSITDSYTEVGIGLAFNNSTEQADHIVLKEDSVIELTVSRGPANVYADNHDEYIELTEGDKVLIKKSPLFAQVVVPKVDKE
jgi:NAD+ kinase